MSQNLMSPPCKTGPFGWPRQALGAETPAPCAASSGKADSGKSDCGKGHTCPLLRHPETPTVCHYRSVDWDWDPFDSGVNDKMLEDIDGMVVELDCGTVIVPTEQSFPLPQYGSYEATTVPVPPTKEDVLDQAKSQLVAQAAVEKVVEKVQAQAVEKVQAQAVEKVQAQAVEKPAPVPEPVKAAPDAAPPAKYPPAETGLVKETTPSSLVKIVNSPTAEGQPPVMLMTDADGKQYIAPAPPISKIVETYQQATPIAKPLEMYEEPPAQLDYSEQKQAIIDESMANLPTPVYSVPVPITEAKPTEMLASGDDGAIMVSDAPVKGAGRSEYTMNPLFAYAPQDDTMVPAQPNVLPGGEVYSAYSTYEDADGPMFPWSAGEVMVPAFPRETAPAGRPQGYEGLWGARGNIAPAPAGCASGACPFAAAAAAQSKEDALDIVTGDTVSAGRMIPAYPSAGETMIPAYDSYNYPAPAGNLAISRHRVNKFAPQPSIAPPEAPRVKRMGPADPVVRKPAGSIGRLDAEKAILDARLEQIASAGSVPEGMPGLWPTGALTTHASVAYRPAGALPVGMGGMWGGGGIVKQESESYIRPGTGPRLDTDDALSLISGDYSSPAGAIEQLGGSVLAGEQGKVGDYVTADPKGSYVVPEAPLPQDPGAYDPKTDMWSNGKMPEAPLPQDPGAYDPKTVMWSDEKIPGTPEVAAPPPPVAVQVQTGAVNPPLLSMSEAMNMLSTAKKLITYQTWPDFSAVDKSASEVFGDRASTLAAMTARDQLAYGNRFQRVLLAINELERQVQQAANSEPSAMIDAMLSTRVVAAVVEASGRCDRYEQFARCLMNALTAIANLDPERVRQHVAELSAVRPAELNTPAPAGRIDNFDLYLWAGR